MEQAIILHNLSPNEFKEFIGSIMNEIKSIHEKLCQQKSKEYLTREEVAKLLKCDLSTVHNMTKRGDIISYGLPQSNRVYYKASEIESSMIQLSFKKQKS
jgi:hypothetical protein